LQIKAKILHHKKVKPGYYRVALIACGIAKEAQAGQFVEIKVNDAWEPLLRRPFSIHRTQGSAFEVLYEVVGQATRLLSRKKPGEYLEVIGPLGKGFDFCSDSYAPLLVAGGMGVAPLVFLAEKMAASNKRATVLLGARDKNSILCEEVFRKLGFSVKIATDNGSRGFRGYVSGLLEHELAAGSFMPQLVIYACGPRPMLQEISRISRHHNIPAWVSLEEHMACGLGVCLGCVVDTVDGYQRVCKEGPVFEARRIIWKSKSAKGERLCPQSLLFR